MKIKQIATKFLMLTACVMLSFVCIACGEDNGPKTAYKLNKTEITYCMGSDFASIGLYLVNESNEEDKVQVTKTMFKDSTIFEKLGNRVETQVVYDSKEYSIIVTVFQSVEDLYSSIANFLQTQNAENSKVNLTLSYDLSTKYLGETEWLIGEETTGVEQISKVDYFTNIIYNGIVDSLLNVSSRSNLNGNVADFNAPKFVESVLAYVESDQEIDITPYVRGQKITYTSKNEDYYYGVEFVNITNAQELKRIENYMNDIVGVINDLKALGRGEDLKTTLYSIRTGLTKIETANNYFNSHLWIVDGVFPFTNSIYRVDSWNSSENTYIIHVASEQRALICSEALQPMVEDAIECADKEGNFIENFALAYVNRFYFFNNTNIYLVDELAEELMLIEEAKPHLRALLLNNLGGFESWVEIEQIDYEYVAFELAAIFADYTTGLNNLQEEDRTMVKEFLLMGKNSVDFSAFVADNKVALKSNLIALFDHYVVGHTATPAQVENYFDGLLTRLAERTSTVEYEIKNFLTFAQTYTTGQIKEVVDRHEVVHYLSTNLTELFDNKNEIAEELSNLFEEVFIGEATAAQRTAVENFFATQLTKLEDYSFTIENFVAGYLELIEDTSPDSGFQTASKALALLGLYVQSFFTNEEVDYNEILSYVELPEYIESVDFNKLIAKLKSTQYLSNIFTVKTSEIQYNVNERGEVNEQVLIVTISINFDAVLAGVVGDITLKIGVAK